MAKIVPEADVSENENEPLEIVLSSGHEESHEQSSSAVKGNSTIQGKLKFQISSTSKKKITTILLLESLHF